MIESHGWAFCWYIFQELRHWAITLGYYPLSYVPFEKAASNHSLGCRSKLPWFGRRFVKNSSPPVVRCTSSFAARRCCQDSAIPTCSGAPVVSNIACSIGAHLASPDPEEKEEMKLLNLYRYDILCITSWSVGIFIH